MDQMPLHAIQLFNSQIWLNSLVLSLFLEHDFYWSLIGTENCINCPLDPWFTLTLLDVHETVRYLNVTICRRHWSRRFWKKLDTSCLLSYRLLRLCMSAFVMVNSLRGFEILQLTNIILTGWTLAQTPAVRRNWYPDADTPHLVSWLTVTVCLHVWPLQGRWSYLHEQGWLLWVVTLFQLQTENCRTVFLFILNVSKYSSPLIILLDLFTKNHLD